MRSLLRATLGSILALTLGAELAAADLPPPAPKKPAQKKPAPTPPPAPTPSPKPEPAKPAPPAKPSYQISAIRAFLYYHASGTFDSRDAIAGPFALWNVIIGEGDAKEPSTATLLQIELGGPSFSNISGQVEIVINRESAKPVRHKLDASDFHDGHATRVLVPVLVYDTGCADVKVDVTFTTPEKKKLKKQAVVPFSCGE